MKSFTNYLTDITFPTEEQRKNEVWDVEGRLKNGNQIFKFDIRPLKPSKDRLEKVGYFKSKADKMVFETEKKWVLFDLDELHQYIKSSDKRDFNIDELLDNLSWNLMLDKVE
jgi:hypothetical protein